MKKSLLVIATVGIMMSQGTAWASKSRMEALGQDNDGSYYILDERSIILNPASLYLLSDKAIFEWGLAGTGAKVDGPSSPKAEGGVLIKERESAYGVYFGDENDLVITLRNLANPALLKPDNTLQILYAKKISGSKAIGGSLTYSGNQNETLFKKTEKTLILKGGIITSKQAFGYAHLKVLDEAKGATLAGDKYEGALSFRIGGGAPISPGILIFGHFDKNAGEYTPSGGTGTDVESQDILVGAGYIRKLKGDKSKLFADVSLNQNTLEYSSIEFTIQSIPVNMGIEAEVRDWLKLRASIGQKVLINSIKTEVAGNSVESTDPDSTQVAAGLTIMFEDFNFDGSFTTGGGQLNANNIMSRVAMIYSF